MKVYREPFRDNDSQRELRKDQHSIAIAALLSVERMEELVIGFRV